MDIRLARIEEAGDIAEVWLRSRAASAPDIPLPVHTEEEVRAWFATVVVPTREVWVAEVDGTVVAVLVLDGTWIDQLYVAPGHTGQGVGTQLVSLAKTHRPHGLRLWTFQANERARRFYERHEFTPVETTDGDNEEGAPDVRDECSGELLRPRWSHSDGWRHLAGSRRVVTVSRPVGGGQSRAFSPS